MRSRILAVIAAIIVAGCATASPPTVVRTAPPMAAPVAVAPTPVPTRVPVFVVPTLPRWTPPPVPSPLAQVPILRLPTIAPVPADPYAAAKAAGATAICADGTWSYSAHRSGTCSHHGGVHWWTGNLGPAGPGGH